MNDATESGRSEGIRSLEELKRTLGDYCDALHAIYGEGIGQVDDVRSKAKVALAAYATARRGLSDEQGRLVYRSFLRMRSEFDAQLPTIQKLADIAQKKGGPLQLFAAECTLICGQRIGLVMAMHEHVRRYVNAKLELPGVLADFQKAEGRLRYWLIPTVLPLPIALLGFVPFLSIATSTISLLLLLLDRYGMSARLRPGATLPSRHARDASAAVDEIRERISAVDLVLEQLEELKFVSV